MATASDKGTLVRLFSTDDGSPLQEVRRGSDKAEIYSIAFDKLSRFFAVSSDKGTIHVFAMQKGTGKIVFSDENREEESKGVEEKHMAAHKAEESKVKNKQHPLSFMKKLLPKYFDG